MAGQRRIILELRAHIAALLSANGQRHPMNHLLQDSGTRDSAVGTDSSDDCADEPSNLTYRRAHTILRAHDRHVGCRQWIAAAAYLSAGLDDE